MVNGSWVGVGEVPAVGEAMLVEVASGVGVSGVDVTGTGVSEPVMDV